MQTTETQRRSPSLLDLLTRQTASTFINIYQKRLSPYKGFSCAYRVLHCSESCSQYTKRVIAELGISQALPLIQQRFQACKAANQTLKVQRQCQPKQQSDRSTLPTWVASQEAPLDDVPLDNEPLDGNETDSSDETLAPDDTQPKQQRNGMSGSVRTPPTVNNADSTGTTQNTGSGWNCDGLDCTSLGCDAIDYSSTDCSSMDCNTGAWQGCDCSSLDYGSCDVGSCDCSS
ncbi:membrane protein insertion efficiency factor YidD [Phormidium sp. FACHB-592]|uniref:Membrane protein insertion efficiency factor YidD n=1 Tax=Stenomitos frigidus AS-A4 TaxID=2933935 RepID=A0ABV0KHK4_9CYAN|nr:membrane protein insertion efficiency factor YidD [Phormidium sp. FACHB-592]MBD2073626.1 membrane protein insertion efficiency factor YidD [Phormidium sp. FACHB-592]